MGLLVVAPLVAATVPAAGTAPSPAVPTATCPGSRPAPEALDREVKRFLKLAAHHATRSSNCRDGSGYRTEIDRVETWLDTATPEAISLSVSFRTATHYEVDTRGRGRSTPSPRVSTHCIALVFRSSPTGFLLDAPRRPAGFDPDEFEPMDRGHDAQCHGRSGRFEAQPVHP